jgi:hypothetical protein
VSNRPTCSSCAHWTRDQPVMGRPCNLGVCGVSGDTKHEYASCRERYQALAEADTDPAPSSGEP